MTQEEKDNIYNWLDEHIDKEIETNEEKITEANLEIEHYQRLRNIDPESDYSEAA